ncbi:MAG: nucleotide pyrophosphohydrolase [bacterium]
MSADSSEDRLDALREKLRRFVAERDWQQFHDPKNLAMALASEAGELLAELRWVPSGESDAFVRDAAARERVEREVGDVAIALLLFCERAGIDPIEAAERKLGLNATNYPVSVAKGHSERPPEQA